MISLESLIGIALLEYMFTTSKLEVICEISGTKPDFKVKSLGLNFNSNSKLVNTFFSFMESVLVKESMFCIPMSFKVETLFTLRIKGGET